MLCSVYLLVSVFSTLCVTYFSMAMANTSTTNTDVLYTVVILWNKHKKYILIFPYLHYVRNINIRLLNLAYQNFKGMPLQKAKVRQPVVKPLLMSTSQYEYQQIKVNTNGVPDSNSLMQFTSNAYCYSSSFPSTYTATSTQAQSLFKASLRTEM